MNHTSYFQQNISLPCRNHLKEPPVNVKIKGHHSQHVLNSYFLVFKQKRKVKPSSICSLLQGHCPCHWTALSNSNSV
jgi:hypothetical protein